MTFVGNPQRRVQGNGTQGEAGSGKVRDRLPGPVLDHCCENILSAANSNPAMVSCKPTSAAP